jgi:hypothetical protein
MRFGVFYEHQLPRPWEPDAEHRLLKDALEQIELADRIGIDYLWEVEHHFLEEYSHSSAPEVFLAAASQRTRQIRLAHPNEAGSHLQEYRQPASGGAVARAHPETRVRIGSARPLPADLAPPLRNRWFADSPLEGSGFELLVPRCVLIANTRPRKPW